MIKQHLVSSRRKCYDRFDLRGNCILSVPSLFYRRVHVVPGRRDAADVELEQRHRCCLMHAAGRRPDLQTRLLQVAAAAPPLPRLAAVPSPPRLRAALEREHLCHGPPSAWRLPPPRTQPPSPAMTPLFVRALRPAAALTAAGTSPPPAASRCVLPCTSCSCRQNFRSFDGGSFHGGGRVVEARQQSSAKLRRLRLRLLAQQDKQQPACQVRRLRPPLSQLRHCVHTARQRHYNPDGLAAGGGRQRQRQRSSLQACEQAYEQSSQCRHPIVLMLPRPAREPTGPPAAPGWPESRPRSSGTAAAPSLLPQPPLPPLLL